MLGSNIINFLLNVLPNGKNEYIVGLLSSFSLGYCGMQQLHTYIM